MNRDLISRNAKKSLQPEPSIEELPFEALPARWGNRAFYVLSALVHIAAAVALSGSWVLGTTTRNASANATEPAPPKPAIARMAIDVGPVKFCELKMEKIVGPPHEPVRR